jgi:hypothetical protein
VRKIETQPQRHRATEALDAAPLPERYERLLRDS